MILRFLVITLLLGNFSSAWAIEDWDTTEEAREIRESDKENASGLKSVFFAYRSDQLSDEAMKILKQNAKVLDENPKYIVQIEGHCDPKGGEATNLPLGQKRADAVKKYLVRQGVNPKALSTISYGSCHLLDPSKSEAANAKNRRVNFVIVSE